MRDSGCKTDIIALDFSKAFDKVPRTRLPNRLWLYGIRGHILLYISIRMIPKYDSRRLYLQYEHGNIWNTSENSCRLVAIFIIHKLPSTIFDPSARCRLLADDCRVHQVINTIDDQTQLQKTHAHLEMLSKQCGTHFKAKRCNVMPIFRKLLDTFYQLINTVWDRVSRCTYLGVKISSNLSWAWADFLLF